MPGVGKEVNKCSEFIYRGAEAARKLSLEKVAKRLLKTTQMNV